MPPLTPMANDWRWPLQQALLLEADLRLGTASSEAPRRHSSNQG